MDFKEPNVDFVGLAESVGVPAVRVTKHEEFLPGLQTALANKTGPNLLSVVVDRGRF